MMHKKSQDLNVSTLLESLTALDLENMNNTSLWLLRSTATIPTGIPHFSTLFFVLEINPSMDKDKP